MYSVDIAESLPRHTLNAKVAASLKPRQEECDAREKRWYHGFRSQFKRPES